MELAPLPSDGSRGVSWDAAKEQKALKHAGALRKAFELRKEEIRPDKMGGSLAAAPDGTRPSEYHRRRSGIASASQDPSVALKVQEQAAKKREAEDAAIRATPWALRFGGARKRDSNQGVMVSHLERETPLPQSAYLRFRVAEDNHALAELARAEREALLLLKEERSASHEALGRERVQERIDSKKRSRKLRKELVRERAKTVRALRDAEKSAEQLLTERESKYYEEMRKRVLEASALDAKLDASEEKDQESARKAGTQRKQEVARQIAETRQHQFQRRRGIVQEIRGEAEKASAEHEALIVTARQRGEVKREEAKEWSLERNKRDETYIEKAKANRERARATRERARAAMAEHLEMRKKSAAKERANDQLVTDEKARILAANRKEVANIYKARFATRNAASEYENSTWRNLAAAATWFTSKSAPMRVSGLSSSSVDSPSRSPAPAVAEAAVEL